MDKIRAIKKIKRQCMVRGCKNKETYSVSCSTELGNSIHICEECAKGVINAINKKYGIPTKQEIIEEKKSEAIEEKQIIEQEASIESKTKKSRKTTKGGK